MRLHLTLECTGRERTLPLNYQYETSAWIYRELHNSDPRFSLWLHEQGYSYAGKRFKHFTFSGIKVEKRSIHQDRLTILSPEVEMQIGFGIPRTMEHFIQGIFQDQSFTIGDRISRAAFAVRSVQLLPEPLWEKGPIPFRTLSPLCVTAGENGKQARYIPPHEPDFNQRITNNLRARFLSLHPDKPLPEGSVRLTVESEPRSRLIRIKAHTPRESRIRGFLFHGTMEGPTELLHLGHQSGFGEKGSLGFGCVEIMQ